MGRTPTHLVSAFCFCLLFALCSTFEHFLALIPNGDAWERAGSGITCRFLGHSDCEEGSPRNQFGLDFAAANLAWTRELCAMDSDGDGLTNGEELGDPCCEWTPDSSVVLRLTDLSHPGVASEVNSIPAGCPTATSPAQSPVVTISVPIIPTLTPFPSLATSPPPSESMSADPVPSESSSAPPSQDPSFGPTVSPSPLDVPSASRSSTALPPEAMPTAQHIPLPPSAGVPGALPSLTSAPSGFPSEPSGALPSMTSAPIITPVPRPSLSAVISPLPTMVSSPDVDDDIEETPVTIDSGVDTTITPSPIPDVTTDEIDSSTEVPTPAVSPDEVDGTETPMASIAEISAEPTSSDLDDAVPTTSPEEDGDGNVCFPGSATVTLRDGRRKAMHEVRVGDEVLAAVMPRVTYSTVYVLTHADAGKRQSHTYVRIRLASGAALKLTPGHYVYVDGRARRASDVSPGAAMYIHDGSDGFRVDSVVAVDYSTEALGLFNPHTVHGDIVVDDVQASTYTASVHSQVAHALLAPVRAAFTACGVSTAVWERGQFGHAALRLVQMVQSLHKVPNHFLSFPMSRHV